MASQKTQDVDSLYVKSIYVRSPLNNAPISTNYTLYADGKGGTYWSTLSNATSAPAFTKVHTDVGDFVAAPSNAYTFNLRAGAGIGMTKGGTGSNDLYIYQKTPVPAFEYFDVSGDNRICADHSNVVYPFFKLAAKGGITLETNPGTNTVTIGSSAIINNLVEGPYAIHQFIVTNFSTPTIGWSYQDPMHPNFPTSTYITAYNNSTSVMFMGTDMLQLSTTIDNNGNNVIFFYLSSFNAADATYISTVIHSSTLVYQSYLNSTIAGLAEAGYISSTQLNSTVEGLGTAHYVSSTQLNSTVAGLSQANYISSTQLNSTIEGLSLAGYISSTQLKSTVTGLGSANYVSSTQLNSTVTGLATARYVSSTQLQSTVEGLGSANYVSSTQLLSSLSTLSYIGYVSSTQLTSTVRGLGSASYVSSTQLQSTVEGLGSANYISSQQLLSSLSTLSYIGYVSSTQLTSTVRGLGSAQYVSSTQLQSTVEGLGTSSYISSSQLTSTTAGLGQIYYSTGTLVSTLNNLASYPWQYTSTTQLISTVEGLGSAGYISSLGLSFQSTVAGLGSATYVSSSQLESTVIGLGSAQYVSSSQLISTTNRLHITISTLSTLLSPTTLRDPTANSASSITLRALVGSNASLLISPTATFNTTSTLSNSAILFSNNTTSGGIQFKDTNSLGITGGTVEINGTLRTLGGLVVDNRARFENTVVMNGLLSTNNNVQINGDLRVFGSQTIISTPTIQLGGATSTIGQAVFASSINVASNALFQASISTLGSQAIGGNLTVNSNATIAQHLTANSISSATNLVAHSNIIARGSVTAADGYFTTSLSTPSFLVSSINNDRVILLANLTSTTTGLGTAGYVSSTQLQSTVRGLGTASYVSSTQLQSTVIGTVAILGSSNYVSSTQLASTVAGLGTANYVSSQTLSTILYSTIRILGSSNYVSSTQLASTVAGLGTANYVSSSQLASTVAGIAANLSLSTITISSIFFDYAAPQFVIASSNAGILYSEYGSNWRSTNVANAREVIYNPAGFLTNQIGQPEYIAVGDKIYGSSNALDWAVIYNSPPAQYTPYSAIAYGSNGGFNTYVALVNDAGTNTARVCYIQSNQTSWGVTSITWNSHTGNAGGIAYSRQGSTDIWIVAGHSTSAQIRATTNLSTWTDNQIFNTIYANGVVYVPFIGRFYAFGNDTAATTNTIKRSVTGSIWDAITSGGFASASGSSNGGAHGLAHNGSNMIVAVGYSTTQAGSIQWSSDGVTFNNALSGGFSLSGGAYTGRAITYSTQLSTWLAVDYATGQVLSSTDGKNWTAIATLGANLQTNHVIALNDPSYVDTLAMYSDGFGTYINNQAIAYVPQVTSTTQGILSSIQANIPSTVAGLGTASYVSSTQLQSTVAGLGTATYISSTQLQSSVIGTIRILGTSNYVSSTQLQSTVAGLGQASYVSSSSLSTILFSTIAILGTSNYVSSTQLTSTVAGLGQAGYVSSSSLSTILFSTIAILGTSNYVSSTQLTSTVEGLGTASYVSSSQLTSTVAGLGQNYVSSQTLSTILFSTIAILGSSNYISSTQLISTVAGLGTAGFICTTQYLNAIVRHPTSRNIGFNSTITSLNTKTSGSIVLSSDLQSLSTTGTGVQNIIAIGQSTLVNNIISNTVNTIAIGFRALENAGSFNLNDAIALGTYSFGLPTANITNGVAIGTAAGYLTSGTSNIYIGFATGYDNRRIGPGNVIIGRNAGNIGGTITNASGYGGSNNVTIGPESGSNASSITNTVAIGYQAGAFSRNTNSVFIGTQAGQSTTADYNVGIGINAGISTTTVYNVAIGGNAGSRNRGAYTVTVGLGAGINNTGTDLVAIGQYAAQNNTGANVIALGAFAGNLNTIPNRLYIQGSPSKPAIVGDLLNSRLGINTGSNPAYTLDVSGNAFIRTNLLVSSISTANIYTSSILASTLSLVNQNAIWTGQLRQSTNRLFYTSTSVTTEYTNDSQLASTVAGLSLASYISSTQLQSTVTGLATASYISSTQLTSTVTGTIGILGSSNYVSSTQLASTVSGLGTAGYVSSQTLSTILYSTIAILGSSNYVSSTQLASTVTGLGTAGYVSTTFMQTTINSTIIGLGSAGYISSPIEGIVSTVIGLGTAGYVSTTYLNSTVTGLLSTPIFSTIRTTNSYLTLGPAAGSNAATSFSYTNTSIFLGQEAGSNSLTYTQVAIGSNAGANLRDSNAISIGQSAGFSSFGEDPISIGHKAGMNNHGSFSISIGADAGFSSFGSNVVSIGNLAGYDNTGVNNNFLGQQAGYSNTADSVNAFGYQSARQNTGNNVIALGYNAAYLNSGSNVIAIGSNAAIANSESNKLFLRGGTKNTVIGDLANNRIAIGGDSNPTATLDVYGDAKISTNLYTVFMSTNRLETSSIRMLDNTATTPGTIYMSSTDLYYTNPTTLQKILYTRDLTSTTTQLISLVQSFIDPMELASTITGLGTAGFVSTLGLDNKLSSTIVGLGTANYVSSTQLVSTTDSLLVQISSMIDPTELASTIIGLGSAGFISTIGLDTKLASTVTGLGTASYVSSIQLISTTQGLGSASYISSTQLQSTIAGLGTARYVSSSQLISTTSEILNVLNTGSTATAYIASTVTGLGTARYVSSSQLASTTETLLSSINNANVGANINVSSISVESVIYRDLQRNTSTASVYLSAGQLYLSTTTSISPITTFSTLQSTILSLGSIGYVSSTQLISTTAGLGSAGYISTAQYANAIIRDPVSRNIGLNSTMTSLSTKTNNSIVLSVDNQSLSTVGTGVQNVIAIGQSTLMRVGVTTSNIIAIGNSAMRQTNIFNIDNTIAIGTGAFDNIQGSVATGIAIGTLSGFQSYGGANIFIGSNTGVSFGFSSAGSGNSNIVMGSLAGYEHRLIRQNNIILGTNAGRMSVGSPSIGYASSNNITIGSDSGSNASSITNMVALGYQAGVAARSTNNIFIGTRAGVSTVYENNIGIGFQAGASTTTGYTTSIGYQAGLNNGGSNTVLIGRNAGQGNTANNVIALGQSAALSNTISDRFYVQGSITKPAIVGDLLNSRLGINTGSNPQYTLDVSGIAYVRGTLIAQALISSYQLATSSIILTDQQNNALLSGSIYMSSQRLYFTSSGVTKEYITDPQLLSTTDGLTTYINNYILPTQLQSSITGLGTASYVSTTQLQSTTDSLIYQISSMIDPTELASTIIGLGSAGFLSTIGLDTKLASTVTGLGTASYVSSSQLLSTSQGFKTYIDSFIDPAELQSTITGLGSAGIVSTLTMNAAFQSTVTGLGSASYISSSQLLSTAQGLATYTSSFIDTTEMNSTVRGLGRVYVSSGGDLLRYDTTNSNIGVTSALATYAGRCNVAIGANQAITFQQTSNIVGAIAIGPGALYQAKGTASGSIGHIAIGIYAGSNISSGNNAITIGRFAGNGAIGEGLIAIGNTPAQNMRGADQLAIGANAGKDLGRFTSTLTGSNIMIGYNAGYEAVCTITNNVMIGTYAGYQGAAGSSNVFIGYSAGNDTNLAVNDAVYIGAMAGRFGIGDHNIAVGQNSFYNGNGNNNIILGEDAGYGVSTNHVIALGKDAGAGNTRGNYFMVKGSVPYHAVIVDLSNAYLGIGANNYPACALDVSGNACVSADLIVDHTITASNISSQTAYIQDLHATDAYVSSLYNTYQSTTYAEIAYISTLELAATNADISSLTTSSLIANNIDAQNLNVYSSLYVAGTLSASIIAVDVYYSLSTISTMRIFTDDLYVKDELYCFSTISTHTIVVYGSNTLISQGTARFYGSSFFTGDVQASNVTISDTLSAANVSTSQVQVSTLQLFDRFTQEYNEMYTSAGRAYFDSFTLHELITDDILVSTTQGLTTYVSSFIDPTELASTVIGLGSAGFLSTLSNQDVIFKPDLISSVAGLGSAGYVSTTTLESSITGLLYTSTTGQIVYNNTTPMISLPELLSTVQSLLNQPTVHHLQTYGF